MQVVGIPWPNRHNVALNNPQYAQSIPELTKHISESLAMIIQNLANQLDPHIPALLLGHLTVSSGVFSGSEKRAVYGQDPILLPSQLAIKPFDYIALGHLHRFQNLNKNGDIPIVYSGSIDRVDFGERKEDKGFCDITIKNKQDVNINFIKLDTRPFIQVDVILEDDSDQTKQIIDKLKQYPIKNAIVKITYKVAAHMTDTVDIKKIQKHCQQAMFMVGIIPIRSLQTRAHRDILKHEMNLETLLNTYFNSQENLKSRAKKLTEKALHLDELKEVKEDQEE